MQSNVDREIGSFRQIDPSLSFPMGNWIREVEQRGWSVIRCRMPLNDQGEPLSEPIREWLQQHTKLRYLIILRGIGGHCFVGCENPDDAFQCKIRWG